MPSDFDAWPDEPAEDDPEDRWGDPESDLVTVPTVGESEAEEDEEEPVEIDSELASTFWAVVVLVNVGVAGISLGAMFIYFRGNHLLGGGAAVVGALALFRAYYTYRGFRDEADSDDTDDNRDSNDTDDNRDSDGDSDDDNHGSGDSTTRN
ncbi:hypothetical protein G3I44_03685 [Halogeometricum borinquense]|uniref:DUF7322 domain-containing protein n=1 Tax=Halogeometricum borinquense TaxID=60847 RepID=A0A6C0UDM3_9EURY|nr:hypothetical protein [Halogeometricum borinquense]QIB73464.1 hypothetical protein G3I44_03685 [Halogeometricum borinquense]